MTTDTSALTAVLRRARDMPPLKTAVVHPVDLPSLQGVAEAAAAGLIDPILVGPPERISQAMAAFRGGGGHAPDWPVIASQHSHAAAEIAVALASRGAVEALMKGALHSDELLQPLVAPMSGLRTERRISHAYVVDVTTYPKPLIITDAAINIAPDLRAKADICRNAINLWRCLFGEDHEPRVAVLAAVETVNPDMPATIDAAALCKMCERGQITGAILDGPLGYDNIVSFEAARQKGLVSPVAGAADIIVVPNIETGNALAKQIIHLGGGHAGGIVLGARVPVMFTSRSDSSETRLTSCAIAVHLAQARRRGIIK